MSDCPEPSFHELYETAHQIVDRIDTWYFLDLCRECGPPQVAEVASFLAELTLLLHHFDRGLHNSHDSSLERQTNASRQHKPVELVGVHTNALRAIRRLATNVLNAATGHCFPAVAKPNLDKASLEEAYCHLCRRPPGGGDNSRKWKVHCKRLMATLSAIDFQMIHTTLALERAPAESFLQIHQENSGITEKSAANDAARIGGMSPAHHAQPVAKPVWINVGGKPIHG